MTGWQRIGALVAVCAAAVGVAAAARPGGLAAASPGLWEVSHSATGVNPLKLCIADPAFLARWEHRTAACSVTKLSEQANRVTFNYRCAAAGFGRSDVTLLTPRSLRIQTQGIADGLPFDSTLHARWLGRCPTR